MDLSNNTSALVLDNRGDDAKILAMVTLGLGSFLSGMLPAFISERNRRRFPLTTSLLLCFGAGVLLATALVHILPEVQEQMSSGFAEIALCGGFFIIYFIDEFIHYFFGEAIQHTHSNNSSQISAAETQQHQHHHNHNHHQQNGTGATNNTRNYGSLSAESEPLLQNSQLNNHHHEISGDSHNCNHTHVHCDDEAVASANARLCYTPHEEPCAQSMTGTLGLFAALSLHSAIEGLAIGVQNSSPKVLILLGAVACHKFVMGFCLGLEFRSNPQTSLRSQFIGILVFALGAVCGIGIGMIIIDIPSSWNSTTLPIIQALAGGTLFYVTVCEVIPRERARWHQNATRKAAGFAQFFAVLLGFAAMCLINFYLGDGDS